jgi:hypothetical protein
MFIIKSGKMKKVLVTLFLVIAMGFTACINSLNPLITYNNIESFDTAAGLWKDDEGIDIKIEKFRGSDLEREFNMQEKKEAGKKDQKSKPTSAEEAKYLSNIYILYFTKNQVDHFMILSFARINGSLFAQFEPLMAEEQHKNDAGSKMKMDKIHIPVWEPGKDHSYSFAKVKMNGGQLQFIPLDEDYMQGLLDKGAMAIPFEKDDLFGSALITASSEQLQKFFYKYGNDERVFNKRYTLVLKQTAL